MYEVFIVNKGCNIFILQSDYSDFFLNICFSSEVVNSALTRQNLASGFSNNTGADQPAHLCGLISAFVIPILESIIFKLLLKAKDH